MFSAADVCPSRPVQVSHASERMESVHSAISHVHAFHALRKHSTHSKHLCCAVAIFGPGVVFRRREGRRRRDEKADLGGEEGGDGHPKGPLPAKGEDEKPEKAA